jgi:hypothetical protein
MVNRRQSEKHSTSFTVVTSESALLKWTVYDADEYDAQSDGGPPNEESKGLLGSASMAVGALLEGGKDFALGNTFDSALNAKLAASKSAICFEAKRILPQHREDAIAAVLAAAADINAAEEEAILDALDAQDASSESNRSAPPQTGDVKQKAQVSTIFCLMLYARRCLSFSPNSHV